MTNQSEKIRIEDEQPTVESLFARSQVEKDRKVDLQNRAGNIRPDTVASRLEELAAAGVKPARIAVESGIPREELERWQKGARVPETTRALALWLEEIDDEAKAREGDFVMTPAASRFLAVFDRARARRNKEGERGVALVFGAAGTGKSMAALYLARMDQDVVYTLVDGECRKWTQLLRQVAGSIDPYYLSSATRSESMKDIILRNVKEGGLLIFDHAHLISVSMIEMLLVFPDRHGVGLAFVGNFDAQRRIEGAKVAQIMSRVAGARVLVPMPAEDDVDALLSEKWQISGRKERELCLQIGRQDGGLRYLEAAIQEARRLAIASGKPRLDDSLIRLGAVNAGCWGVPA